MVDDDGTNLGVGETGEPLLRNPVLTWLLGKAGRDRAALSTAGCTPATWST